VLSYKVIVWGTDMWRGFSFRTLFVVLLAVQVLIPPAWVKRGLDCALRCRLAATTGAHCPLMYGAHQTKPPHHCHEQGSASSAPELRCNCSHASPSSSTLDVIRCVLPQVVTVTAIPLALPQSFAPVPPLVTSFLTPPDPPPRALSLSVL